MFHRDFPINAINLGFMLSTLVLLALLGKIDSYLIHIISISMIGIIPACLGIYIGSKLRHRISDERFHIAVLIILLIIGNYLILN